MTSDTGKRLNTVQFLSRVIGSGFASVAHDFKYWGLPTDHILESTIADDDKMLEIVLNALDDFPFARRKYHQALRPVFWGWLLFIDYRRSWRGIICSYRTLRHYISRNGVHWLDILDFYAFFKVVCIACRFIIKRPSK